MQVCKERYLISKSNKPFPSKSDPSRKPYRTYAFRDGEMPMCTCLPFLTGRKREAKKLGVSVGEITYSCSHLKRVLTETCDWRQETDADYQWNQTCPKCGDELIDTDTYDVPDDPEGQIDDLRILLAELKGTGRVLDPDPEPEAVDRGSSQDAASALLNALK